VASQSNSGNGTWVLDHTEATGDPASWTFSGSALITMVGDMTDYQDTGATPIDVTAPPANVSSTTHWPEGQISRFRGQRPVRFSHENSGIREQVKGCAHAGPGTRVHPDSRIRLPRTVITTINIGTASRMLSTAMMLWPLPSNTKDFFRSSRIAHPADDHRSGPTKLANPTTSIP